MDLFDHMPIEVVGPYFMLEVIGGRKEVQASIQRAYFFLILLIGLSTHFDERSNDINKVPNSHTANNLHNRDEKPLIII